MILLLFLNLKRDQYEIHFSVTRFSFETSVSISDWRKISSNQQIEHLFGGSLYHISNLI